MPWVVILDGQLIFEGQIYDPGFEAELPADLIDQLGKRVRGISGPTKAIVPESKEQPKVVYGGKASPKVADASAAEKES